MRLANLSISAPFSITEMGKMLSRMNQLAFPALVGIFAVEIQARERRKAQLRLRDYASSALIRASIGVGPNCEAIRFASVRC